MRSKILTTLAGALLATSAFAHGDHDPDTGRGKPPPFAILQLDQVRDATARFVDVAQAEKEGYHDIGLFVPNMGWHYRKDRLVDGRFEPTRPVTEMGTFLIIPVTNGAKCAQFAREGL